MVPRLRGNTIRSRLPTAGHPQRKYRIGTQALAVEITENRMRGTILAIDPGTKCGWALLSGRGVHIASGSERFAKPKEPLGLKFQNARAFFRSRLSVYKPDYLVCERLGHFKSSAAVISMFGIVAQLREMAFVFDLEFNEVSPPAVKKCATGDGRADKKMMIAAAQKRWNLGKISSDQADALWVGELFRKS